jgi:hypothetical protein
VTPACLQKRSSSEGGASCDGEWGGGVTSPSSSSSSSSSSPSTSSSSEDSGSEGVLSPPVPSPSSGQHFRPVFSISVTATIHCRHDSLPASPRPWVRDLPEGRYKHTRDPAQKHECVEKLKLAHAVDNESEQTHPGVVDLFP